MTAPTEAMVEKVARALFGPLNTVWDIRWQALHDNGFAYVKWNEDLQSGKLAYQHDAKIAIAALRVPDEAVVEAVVEAIGRVQPRGGLHEVARAAWTAGIDAILGEKIPKPRLTGYDPHG
jgi:hypothetical protein